MVNAQAWLDINYTLENRKEIIELNINDRALEGSLIIENFPNLKLIDCSNNRLTKIIIGNCYEITSLNACNNFIAELILNSIELENFTRLDLSNNSFFPAKVLSAFDNFINLEYLNLNNSSFFGSLEPLANMRKIKEICISNTDIDSGLEHLPDSLRKIECWFEKKPNCRVKKIDQQLENFDHDLELWRKSNSEKVRSVLTRKLNNIWEQNVLLLRENKKLREQPTVFYEEITKLIKEKEKQLKTLKDDYFQGTTHGKEKIQKKLETLLEAQKEVIFFQSSFAAKESDLLKEKLIRKRPKFIGELNKICQMQEEIISLKLQLKEMKEIKEKISITGNVEGNVFIESKFNDSNLNSVSSIDKRIINNIINKLEEIITNVNNGHALIGNIIGNDANFSHNVNKLLEEGKKIRNRIEIVIISEWTNIHPNFLRKELIENWLNKNFTVQQVQEWENVFRDNFEPNNCDFYVWLRDSKQVTAEWCLNNANLAELKTEYQTQQLQLQTNIEQPI